MFDSRNALRALVVVLALCALLVMRAEHSGAIEAQRAAESERAGDLDSTVIHLRRAAGWWWPGSDAARQALVDLRRVAGEARVQGNAAVELSALRAWLAARQSRRWLGSDSASGRAIAERVAALSIGAKTGDGPVPSAVAQKRARLVEQLLSPAVPKPLGVLLASIGFVCWVGAAFRFSRRGLDDELRLTPQARTLGTWLVLGFGMFVLGLALA